jgi:hypothetical protein
LDVGFLGKVEMRKKLEDQGSFGSDWMLCLGKS